MLSWRSKPWWWFTHCWGILPQSGGSSAELFRRGWWSDFNRYSEWSGKNCSLWFWSLITGHGLGCCFGGVGACWLFGFYSILSCYPGSLFRLCRRILFLSSILVFNRPIALLENWQLWFLSLFESSPLRGTNKWKIKFYIRDIQVTVDS